MRVVHCVVSLALVAGACATPQGIREGADRLAAQSRECELRGDQRCSIEKRDEAEREYRKARLRTYGPPGLL